MDHRTEDYRVGPLKEPVGLDFCRPFTLKLQTSNAMSYVISDTGSHGTSAHPRICMHADSPLVRLWPYPIDRCTCHTIYVTSG